MTLMKSSRAGLFALAFGILMCLFLSVAHDVAYAQAQAPAAAPAAAPATPPAPPPACANDPDPKKAVLEKCTPNSGDTELGVHFSRTAHPIRATPPGC